MIQSPWEKEIESMMGERTVMHEALSAWSVTCHQTICFAL